MSEQDKQKEMNTESAEAPKEKAEYTPNVQPDFLRERIKQKPVNKKKLLRRTLLTVSMAVVFGLVACLTFLILEPVISNKLHPEEEAQKVAFPEETVTEEMKPEDMVIIEEEETEPVTAELEDEQIEELLSQVEFSLEDYRLLYQEMASLANTVNRSIVTVTGVTSDVDWFDNTYENGASASGVIVANNGKSILILVSANVLKNVDDILVTFCDQYQTKAELVRQDRTLDFAVISVPLISIEEDTMDVISIAKLGSSNTSNMLGCPIMALGSPMGMSGSVNYGMVTSTGMVIDRVDTAYKKMTTNIYGSKNASGIIVNLKGLVIGIIDSNNSGDMSNLLTAYGISEMKRAVEKMSNDQDWAFLGVHGVDIPVEARREMNIPGGTYIKEIEMDSPAMAAGIQSGDVIVRVGKTDIRTYNDLLNVLYTAEPEASIEMGIIRQGKEMSVDVTYGVR